MKEISVLFFRRIFSTSGSQKGMGALKLGKQASAALVALACLVPSGAVLGPVDAKGTFENVSAPFDVVDETIGDKPCQVVKMVVRAKPEQVFRILTDYENAPSVFPHLLKCHVLQDRGDIKVVEHKVQPSGPFGTFDYVLEVKEVPFKSLEWHRVRGDFKEVDGYWKLEPLEGGHQTLVSYTSHVNGGFFIPAPLIKRQVHMDMPGVMSALKTQAETSTQIAGRPVAPSIRRN
jgi:ribosome-associated toxin RatA of RatAB toxin-antitoxin module